MLWLAYALISAVSDGFKSIVHRHVMKTESPYSYALIEEVLTALAFIPLLYKEFVAPTGIFPWFLVAASSVLWTIIVLTSFNAYKFTHVSLKEPISQTRLIFVFILSIILLAESITMVKGIGTLIIFFGIVTLTYHKGEVFGRLSEKGVRLTLLSALLMSIVAIIDKKAMSYFTPGMFGFLVYLIPGLILLLFVKKRTQETKKLIKTKWPYVLLVIMFGMSMYYFNLKAYTLAEASVVFPIIRISSFISVLGGMFIFKEERKDILRKVIASIIIILGAILISGNYSIF